VNNIKKTPIKYATNCTITLLEKKFVSTVVLPIMRMLIRAKIATIVHIILSMSWERQQMPVG